MMQPKQHLDNNPDHVFVPTKFGPGYWVPKGDYVENTVGRGAKNSGYNNFLKYMKPNARTAVDVGANIGEITWSLAQFAQHVQAFEPVSNTFDLLQKNVDQNDLTNVTLHNMGVGETTEECQITLSTNTCGANARLREGSNSKAATETMRIEPLDSLNLLDVDIMKIDVEGYELDVLKGGELTIVRDRPIIQLEVYEQALKRAKRDVQDIYDWLIARGFNPYYVKYRKITADGTSYTHVPKCIERFFIHSSITVPAEVPADFSIVVKEKKTNLLPKAKALFQ